MDKGQDSDSVPSSPALSTYRRLAAQLADRDNKIDDYTSSEQPDLNAGQLALLIAFDDTLKEMASIKHESKETLTKEQRKKYYGARAILVLLYFIVVPYCQSPAWCLEFYHKQNYRNFGFFDCDAAAMSEDIRVRYSAFPTFSPMVTIMIDVVCMICFCVMACFENKWRNQSKNEKRRTGFLIIAVVISIIDLTRAFFAMKYPYFANLMRVIVLLSFMTRLRQAVMSLFGDLRDSFAILLTIFTYILIFVLTVYYFYRSTFEGFQNFGTIRDSYKNMTILFTTANFPDVFLPAMNINFFNSMLFMFFMLMGLYFLTNLLTANVFNKYMERLHERRSKRKRDRVKYVKVVFDKHDNNRSGELDNMEAKAFLADVFDYDYHNETHRKVAKQILNILDTEDTGKYREEDRKI